MEIDKILEELRLKFGDVKNIISEVKQGDHFIPCSKCTGAMFGDDGCNSCKGGMYG